MKYNLPKTAKEQKAWMKQLGITNIKCAKLAIIRDEQAAVAVKRLAKRDYTGAVNAIRAADRMQAVILSTEEVLKAFK